MKEPATTTEAAKAQFRDVNLSELKPSPNNPRKHFEPKQMADLIASVKEKNGVIVPLIARPHPKGGFEVLAGERRYRAAKAAGLATVPVRVMDLNDAEALEIQVIENLQRADVHPLEEADGYKELHDKHGLSTEAIAAKVGKSPAYVYGRMKLAHLEDEKAREAFFAGEMGIDVAIMIARLPKALQEQATAGVLKKQEEFVDGKWASVPMSSTSAKKHLLSNYTLRLKDTSFDQADATLVPKAGACLNCPKRTGNQPKLFDVESPDMCTDPQCFSDKKRATVDRTLAAAEEKGIGIVTEKDAKKLWPNNWMRLEPEDGTGYVALDAVDPLSKNGKHYRASLRKHTPPVVAVAVHPISGAVVELATTDALNEAYKAAGVKVPKAPSASRSSAGGSSYRAPKETPALKAKRLKAEAKTKADAAHAAKVKGRIVERIADALEAKGATVLPALRILLALDPYVQVDECLTPREAAHYLELVKSASDPGGFDGSLHKAVGALTLGQLVGLMVLQRFSCKDYGSPGHAVVIGGQASMDSEFGKVLDDLARAYKVDVKKVAAEVAAEREPSCSECGCTEANACPGGCGWVKQPDPKTRLGLCTECVAPAKKPASPKAKSKAKKAGKK